MKLRKDKHTNTIHNNPTLSEIQIMRLQNIRLESNDEGFWPGDFNKTAEYIAKGEYSIQVNGDY